MNEWAAIAAIGAAIFSVPTYELVRWYLGFRRTSEVGDVRFSLNLLRKAASDAEKKTEKLETKISDLEQKLTDCKADGMRKDAIIADYKHREKHGYKTPPADC
jgi:uncharacterized protein YlxW (UPF0749 family)